MLFRAKRLSDCSGCYIELLVREVHAVYVYNVCIYSRSFADRHQQSHLIDKAKKC